MPDEEKSQWFKGLDLDLTKPLGDNRGVRLCVPDPEQLWHSEEVGTPCNYNCQQTYVRCFVQATSFWSPSQDDLLPYVPCERLLNEAKASMLFASDRLTPFSESKPEIIFGRADRFKGSEGRAICNPQVVNFYTAASMLKGLRYLAVLGVSNYAVQRACIIYMYKCTCILYTYIYLRTPI